MSQYSIYRIAVLSVKTYVKVLLPIIYICHPISMRLLDEIVLIFRKPVQQKNVLLSPCRHYQWTNDVD